MKKSSLSATFIIQNSLLACKLAKRMEHPLGFHGISFTEYMIMHHLSGAPLKTMRRIELAEQVGLSALGITRLIAPMEKIQWWKKNQTPETRDRAWFSSPRRERNGLWRPARVLSTAQRVYSIICTTLK